MLNVPSLRVMDGVNSSYKPRIYLCLTPTDMRCGFDTLAQRVSESLGCDALGGDLFLFISRGRDRIKILYWDHDGYALWYKRLEAGTFRVPKVATGLKAGVELRASELAMLLEGIDLRSLRRSRRYERKPAPPPTTPTIITTPSSPLSSLSPLSLSLSSLCR